MEDAKEQNKDSDSIKDLFREYSTSEAGLSTPEVKERLEKHGYNEISEKKVSPLMKFLSSFWEPIPWMIEIAAILSALIHHWADFWIIFALLLLNAGIGFWQERKAGNAIELLKKKLALKARVLRDGKWLEMAARELVPGDIVRVRLGDIIPADIRLIDGDYLSVDESALTGESLPVEKHVADMGYGGAIIRQGEMNAVVTATGMNSYFGKTAKLVAETKTQSHFQKAVIKIGNYLIILAVTLVALIFLVAIFRHESVMDTLQFALVLTIAAIPVALPAVLSVTMAVGAVALSKKKAIVSRLSAIEEMAGMDVLCLDKTGTITQNKLTLAPVEPFAGFEDTDVLLFGTLASKEENQDPIDDAIIHKGRSVEGVTEAFGSYKVLKFKPFDPVAKRTEAIIEDSSGNRFKTAKGAPQIILSLVTNKEDIAAKVEEEVDNFAAKGYRTLGVARTDKQENWQYVGLIPLYDPPRDDSAETIKAAHAEGIEVKVITGDHAAITKEIGQQVNVGTSFLESLPPLFKEEMSEVKITPDIFPVSSFLDKPDREAKRIVEKADGFAQVFPEHKYAIVELLQSNGHIVGMTGDGVNDAPALKKADTGVAVAGATDAAKAAADIVLTSPGLSVILHAVEESRKIFQRMNSYALYRISETIRVLFFITASILAFNFYPITAMMIVLLALFNDAPIMTIAYDNVRYSNKPEKWNMPAVLGISTAIGLVGVFFSFGIFYIALRFLHLPPAMMQSFIFLKLAVAGHLTIFVTRTRGHFWSIKPSAALFWSTVITKLLATLLVVYGWFVTPIGWKLALFVWVYALIEELVITDWVKVSLYKMIDRGKMKLKDRMRMKRYFAN